MDTARLKSIATLGLYFNRHLLRSLIPRRKPDQAELFKSYFRDDRLTSLTAAEHEALFEFETCIACGLCPSHCRVLELAPDRFRGPMHLAVAASRSQPDFIHDLDSLLLCAACGQCEPICPEAVPVARMAAAMRAMIWRVAPDRLPPAYRTAQDNLKTHGNVYGPVPALDLPGRDGADHALVLGPRLRRDPARATRVFEALVKLGYDLTPVREGTIGGVAASLGLSPDTAWVDELGALPARTVIAADPETWIALREDPRLAGKSVKFILEPVAERWPEGRDLSRVLPGPAAAHDPWPLARGSAAWRAVREFLARGGVKLVEMKEHGPEAPPLGWEGGVELVAPELAQALARARALDARETGAIITIALGAADAESLETAVDPKTVVYIMDAVHQALDQT